MRMHCMLLIMICFALLGCPGENEDSLAKKTGESLGKNMTDLASGIGKGIDKGLSVEVALSSDFTEKGLTKTIAKSMPFSTQEKGITVYLISDYEQSVSMMAKAINAEGMEIGRSKISVDFEKDGAQYVDFVFDQEVDLALVKEYQLSIAQ